MSPASAGAPRVATTAQIRIATDNIAADAAIVSPAYCRGLRLILLLPTKVLTHQLLTQ